MLKVFEKFPVKAVKPKSFSIDNFVFKLHYRATVAIFFVFTILVTSRQYIGEHIRCLSDSGVSEKVMNTYCFFTSTFTVVKHLDYRLLDDGVIAHPGVGPYITTKDEIKRHAYYQWVPFVLFIQGLMFYLTHLLWKMMEGGKMKSYTESLKYAQFALGNATKVGDNNIPAQKEIKDKIEIIRDSLSQRKFERKSWYRWLIICEILNVVHVIIQFYITNAFLGDRFYNLGSEAVEEGFDMSIDVLDEVFPKVTKCTFHKYGPSGTLQIHDAMCVMALNVINEKIYLFLWFWFIFLLAATLLGFIWRFVTFALYRNDWFYQLLGVPKKDSFSDWIFYSYLKMNVDPFVFDEISKSSEKEKEESLNSDTISDTKKTLLPK